MQNPFKRFMKAFEPASDSVIGIDIGSAYLKVVQLRRKSGKAVLETYGELALGPYAGIEVGRATRLSTDQLSEALRDVMREAHVTTAQGGVAIPFSSSLVTMIDMPALAEKDLEAAVPIEARKYVPVPISEVNLEWWMVPKGPTHEAEDLPSKPAQLQVLIAAIHNEAMTRYETVVKGAGVTPGFFEIELFSTIRALFPQDLEAHAILDLGAAETKLYIVDSGLLRLSHSIAHGAQDLTLALSRGLSIKVEEAEKQKRSQGLRFSEGQGVAGTLRGMLDVVFAETNHGLRNFEHRYGRKAKDLYLTGGGANLIGLEEIAAASASVPVVRANPFSYVEAPAFLDEVLRSVGPEFSVALGIAFRRLQEGA